MQTLIFINKVQFGYHTDTLKYVNYLKDSHNLSYICFDMGRKKHPAKGVNVTYIPHTGKKICDAYQFFKGINQQLQHCQKGSEVFVVNFDFCFLITLFRQSLKYILDIRTLCVSESSVKRFYRDSLTKLNTYFFDKVSVISKGVAANLKLANYRLLPLGSDVISTTDKDFTVPKLLYIGTLDNRNISDVIIGYCRFIGDYQAYRSNSELHIVGTGKAREVSKIKQAIQKFDVHSNVTFHGYKTHADVQYLFDCCNIGVSFIPQKSYYEHQPPTKTFEYLLSGMMCIGTETAAHQAILAPQLGVICTDSPHGIYKALITFLQNKNSYKSSIIRNRVSEYKWKNIVNRFLKNGFLK